MISGSFLMYFRVLMLFPVYDFSHYRGASMCFTGDKGYGWCTCELLAQLLEQMLHLQAQFAMVFPSQCTVQVPPSSLPITSDPSQLVLDHLIHRLFDVEILLVCFL